MTHSDEVDALIVGAGPIGLAVAISARRRGWHPLLIDAGALCQSIVDYPIGMRFFTTPERLEIGGHPLPVPEGRVSREAALAYYRGVVRVEGLDFRTGVRLTGIRREDEQLAAMVRERRGEGTIRAQRIVIATGYFEQPNLLDVPGEALPHVHHRFVEPHLLAGLDVVVVGGKNSAVESALLAWRAGARVTLVHRGPELGASVKYWLKPDFENRVAAGEIQALFGASVSQITDRWVTVKEGDNEHAVPADAVFLLTGYHPDFALFESMGIALERSSGRAILNPHTLESNIPGLYFAGSAASGRNISEVFIENGRYDGEKIFGDIASQEAAEARYAASHRPRGE